MVTIRVKLMCMVVITSVVIFFYSTVRSKSDSIGHKMASDEQERRRKVVFILSNQRSGSTFTGGFFAENSQAFYLYEPLHPFGMSCTVAYEKKLEFLRKISMCDFKTLVETYRNAFKAANVKSNFNCASKHICSGSKHTTMLSRYTAYCEDTSNASVESMHCGRPLDLNLWSSFCGKHNLVAYKILRVCSLEDLDIVARQLRMDGNDVYVVELVRDLRGIVNSALKLELKLEGLDARLDQVCGRYSKNLEYKQQQENKLGQGTISGGKYMRIRYEDIAEDPIGEAETIYRFIGLDLPEEVKIWIKRNTEGADPIVTELKEKLQDESLSTEERSQINMELKKVKLAGNSPYGTTRNSSTVLMKWRKSLKMNIVTTIQEKCGDIMTKFGYKLIQTEEEKLDFNTKLW